MAWNISDALVVGVPAARFGNVVVAVVEGSALTESTIDVPGIQAHARKLLTLSRGNTRRGSEGWN